jgi:hypothetical protein
MRIFYRIVIVWIIRIVWVISRIVTWVIRVIPTPVPRIITITVISAPSPTEAYRYRPTGTTPAVIIIRIISAAIIIRVVYYNSRVVKALDASGVFIIRRSSAVVSQIKTFGIAG